MKTTLRILAILLLGVLVAGAIYLTVENTTLLSSTSGTPGLEQPASMADSDTAQPPARPEGETDHDAASLTRGMSEVLVMLAKISGISFLVLLIQYVIARFKKRPLMRPVSG